MFASEGRIKLAPAILTSRAAICVLIVGGWGIGNARGEQSLMDLRKQTRKLLTVEATTPSGTHKFSAAHALCDLYVVLRSDPRYDQSPMLRGDAAQVRKRMMRIAQRTKSKLKRDKIDRPKNLESRIDDVLNQLQSESSADETSQQQVGNGGAAIDDGWSLVELIQRIIAPDFWEPQGGPGVVRYFAIKRALVVRATSDVHEQVQELLSALR